MKIRAHVIQASDVGDCLKITAQGQAYPAKQWSPILSIEVDVPIGERNRRAFYVGREITVTIEPA